MIPEPRTFTVTGLKAGFHPRDAMSDDSVPKLGSFPDPSQPTTVVNRVRVSPHTPTSARVEVWYAEVKRRLA